MTSLINSWHSLSSTSSKERILLLACSSIQTLSQPFLNNLLRNISASKLMAQWPTDKFVLQSDLDKRCIHLFSNKSSMALLIRNNQLYHYLIVFDIFKKLSYTELKYFKNLWYDLTKKLPHLKVYILFEKDTLKVTDFILTSQNFHTQSKNFDFGVHLSLASDNTIALLYKKYLTSHLCKFQILRQPLPSANIWSVIWITITIKFLGSFSNTSFVISACAK